MGGDSTSNAPVFGTTSDIEGNSYRTVIIGNQKWFAENLRVTSYNDGSSMHSLTDQEWIEIYLGAKSREGGYCWYNNDRSFFEQNKYGAIYNFFAVQSKKLCPQGWRIPRRSDYGILYAYLQEQQVAMGIVVNVPGAMMEKGNWGLADTYIPDNIRNSSGFSALPGGSRGSSGQFNGFDMSSSLGYRSTWWTYSDDVSGWEAGQGFNSIIASQSYTTYSTNNEFNKPQGIEFHSGKYCRCIKE